MTAVPRTCHTTDMDCPHYVGADTTPSPLPTPVSPDVTHQPAEESAIPQPEHKVHELQSMQDDKLSSLPYDHHIKASSNHAEATLPRRSSRKRKPRQLLELSMTGQSHNVKPSTCQ